MKRKVKEVDNDEEYIYVRYITKNGIRIYPKTAKAFKIKVKKPKAA